MRSSHGETPSTASQVGPGWNPTLHIRFLAAGLPGYSNAVIITRKNGNTCAKILCGPVCAHGGRNGLFWESNIRFTGMIDEHFFSLLLSPMTGEHKVRTGG